MALEDVWCANSRWGLSAMLTVHLDPRDGHLAPFSCGGAGVSICFNPFPNFPNCLGQSLRNPNLSK